MRACSTHMSDDGDGEVHGEDDDEDDDGEDAEVGVQDKEEDDDAEEEHVGRKTDPKTGQHTLCQPAQSKRTGK